MKPHRIQLSSSNAYLLEGKKNFLIDCGSQGDLERLQSWFSKHKKEISAVDWVILTHGHSDHAGLAAALQREYGLKVALHAGDIELVRTGRNGSLTPTSIFARLLKPIVDQQFPAFEPDLIFSTPKEFLETEFPLDFILTPGHTCGSISFANQDFAIVGDILRGSPIWAQRAAYHFFIESRKEIEESIHTILQIQPKIIFPGHFGPIPLASALRAFKK